MRVFKTMQKASGIVAIAAIVVFCVAVFVAACLMWFKGIYEAYSSNDLVDALIMTVVTVIVTLWFVGNTGEAILEAWKEKK